MVGDDDLLATILATQVVGDKNVVVEFEADDESEEEDLTAVEIQVITERCAATSVALA